MICPVCNEQGLTSTIRTGGWVSTLMFSQDYYDEAGKHHSHDPNSSFTVATCSNGHRLHITTYPTCNTCGWKRGELKIGPATY